MGFSREFAGFTLIELIATMAVAAILATMSVGFISVIADNRRAAAISDVLSSVGFARFQAISRGMPVTICRSADPLTTCGTGSGWESGWIVFSDPGNPGVIDSSETIISVHGPLSNGQTIRGTAAVAGVSAGTADRITFNPFGITMDGTTGNLLICDSRGISKARSIVISAGGGMLSTDPASTVPASTSCPTPS